MTENEKWDAVIGNDSNADGQFYYAVKTTGVFCRPSCKSKVPGKDNVLYFDCVEDAIAAGFRPCKRCRPELADYQPQKDIAKQTKILIEQYHSQKEKLTGELQKLGMSHRRIAQIFKQEYGVSPTVYANDLKIQIAKDQLKQSNLPVIDIAYSLGFESLSAFFTFFRNYTGLTPGEYRDHPGKSQSSAKGFFYTYDTILGPITIASSGSAIVALKFGSQMQTDLRQQRSSLTDRTADALNEYFSGKRKHFDIPLDPQGTEFQKSVWKALCQIPFGEVRTYKEIAQAIGKPNSSRAVGMANNKNPILLLIPCHRVIGSNGSLGGYSGGMDKKEKLLQLEQEFKFS